MWPHFNKTLFTTTAAGAESRAEPWSRRRGTGFENGKSGLGFHVTAHVTWVGFLTLGGVSSTSKTRG